jgi:arylsulfatase A-like enzyme
VLWLMTDEQRTDSLSCGGGPAPTPTLDRLAGEGVRFRNALTPAPICAPARTAILTGLRPAATGIWSNDQAEDPALGPDSDGVRVAPPLTEAFAAAGYRTASFGKHHHRTEPPRAFATQRDDVHEHLAARERGEGDLWLSGEVDYFGYASRWDEAEFDVVKYPPEPFPWVLAGRFPRPWAETAEARTVDAAKRWLSSETRSPDPFLLRLSFHGPHTPVAPPAPWDTCVDPDVLPDPEPVGLPTGSPPWLEDIARIAASSRLPAKALRRARQAYYGEVAFIDWLIGELLDWMDARGLLDNLVIAFCSDHGCHLGDFGLLQKQTFFDPVVNVPYLFWGPDRIAARAPVETPVGVIGLLPTLLDLAGLEVPAALEPLSLAPTLTAGTDPLPSPIFSEFTPIPEVRPDDRLATVRDGDWKLSLRLGPEPDEPLLVNLATDPLERTNLAGDPAARGERERLTSLLIGRDGGELSPRGRWATPAG